MPSGNNHSLTLLHFPEAPKARKRPNSEQARQHADELQEMCQEVRRALAQIRNAVSNALLDLTENLDLDRDTLVKLLDERPSVIEDLLTAETDSLTTEMMLDFLDKLRIR